MSYLTSTASLSNSLRFSIMELQGRLGRAQQEQATGRHADMSVALGSQLGRLYGLGVATADLDAISTTNAVVASRLEATASSLTNLSEDAARLRAASVLTTSDRSTIKGLRVQAGATLQSYVGYLNTAAGSQFIFGGVNDGAPPIAQFASSPASAAKQAIDAAFLSAFGFPQSAAGVGSISPSQMQSFLSGAFAAQFSGTNWSTNWSAASDDALESRISPSRVMKTSVSANEAAFQKLATGYAMLSELPIENLSRDTYQTVVDAARQYIEEGLSGLRFLQASVGAMRSDVETANRRMEAQKVLLTRQMSALQGVDSTETAVLINQLMTQLQASYSLTSRIQQLSLAKYL